MVEIVTRIYQDDIERHVSDVLVRWTSFDEFAASYRQLSVVGAVSCAGGAARSSAAIRGIRTQFVPGANHRCDID
jgi:hypothetical protein